MRNIARLGDFLDHDGVVISNIFNLGTVFVEGKPISIFGDNITNHNVGGDSHNGARLSIEASPTVFAYGRGIIRSGDHATCGGTVVATTIKTFTP